MGLRRAVAPALAAACLAFGAGAQEVPLGGEAFRALSEGWTLHFELDGRYYGSEEFRENGETLWRPAGGQCSKGLWSEIDGRICFFYGTADIACWRMFRDVDGEIYAVGDGATTNDETRLRLSGRDEGEINCDPAAAVSYRVR